MRFPVRNPLVLGMLLALGVTDAGAWNWSWKKEGQPAAPVAPGPPPPQWIYSGDPAVAPQVAQTDLMLTAPPDVQSVARWAISTRDNRGTPFVMVDKPTARAYAFNEAGQLVAVAPVLLGMAKGDQMLVPNAAPMSAIPPNKRITPAGRYWSRLALDAAGKQVLVIDYDAALSLHPIVKGQPHEKRAHRIATATPDDNRVSFGCINAPVAFFSGVVGTLFAGKTGVVYILPESLSAAEYFGFQPDVVAPGTPQISTAMGATGAEAAVHAVPPAGTAPDTAEAGSTAPGTTP